MRLMYQHKNPGPGPVFVKAPKEIPVFVTVDGDFARRSVEVVINDGRELAAWAGPSGPRGRIFSVEVGRPSAASFMKGFFGFRSGASVPGGGKVTSGRDSVAAGGDITGCAIGSGAVVTGSSQRSLPTGIHLSIPFHCEFDMRHSNPVTVTVGEQLVDLSSAYLYSYVEMP